MQKQRIQTVQTTDLTHGAMIHQPEQVQQITRLEDGRPVRPIGLGFGQASPEGMLASLTRLAEVKRNCDVTLRVTDAYGNSIETTIMAND